MNREVWQSWTPADREAVRAAAVQAGAENVVAARKGIAAPDTEAIRQIEANGVTVTRLAAAQRQAFRTATRGVYDKWAAQIGRDLVKDAEAAIAKR